MPDSDLDPYDFSLSQENDFSYQPMRSLNRVFACLPTQAKTLSVTRGFQSISTRAARALGPGSDRGLALR